MSFLRLFLSKSLLSADLFGRKIEIDDFIARKKINSSNLQTGSRTLPMKFYMEFHEKTSEGIFLRSLRKRSQRYYKKEVGKQSLFIECM